MRRARASKAFVAACALAAIATSAPVATAADEATYAEPNLTPEVALKAAQVALKKCRDSGYQVAVAVVDRSGVAQVVLRDRFAGPHTPDTAVGKAWTAVSFRTNTSDLLGMTAPGQPAAGIRDLPRVVVLGGGLKIEARGNIVGAIGISGAPGGHLDDQCGKAGIDAIKEALEL